MASATPPNGVRSPNGQPVKGKRNIVPAIPLHYPNHRRGPSKAAVSQETTTPAKSEKSDAGSGDERLASHSDGVQHPMTPESLSSSVHKVEAGNDSREGASPLSGKTSEDAKVVNGHDHNVASMPPLEQQSTITPSSTHAQTEKSTGGAARTNGENHAINGDSEKSAKTKPRSNSKPLRVLQAPPPEFQPSKPSSTPLSASSAQMFYPPSAPPQENGYPAYAPQMPPRPFSMVGFNPEAVFQPMNQPAPQMSRTPSHTSSGGRPLSGIDMQSPIMPMPGNVVHEIRMQAAAALQDHILQTFDRPGAADLTIVFSPQNDKTGGRRILAHTLVVYRSKKLLDMVSELEKPNQTVRVEATSRYMTEIGFVGALRSLYGAPLWFPETLFGELGQLTPEFLHGAPSAYVMPHVLSYISSGHYLGLPEVVQAGLACVQRLQTWDNIVQCLAFGLEGGLSFGFWASVSPTQIEMTNADATAPEPTHGHAASEILYMTLFWIIRAFPHNFQFAPSAAQLTEAPRLPTVIENRPSQANPRLSLIQFGDMAIEESGRPDYITMLISSILLSLPFTTLAFILDHPLLRQRPDHASLAEAVVQERENRRKLVLSAKRLKDANDPRLWDATKWNERVVFEHNHFQLRRERIESHETAGA